MTEKLILVLEYHQLIINKLMMLLVSNTFKKDYEKFKDELPYSGRWFYKFNNINKDNLLKGINNFESLLRYISEPKIIKKQKRNDE